MLVHFWETRDTSTGTRVPIVGRLRFRATRSRVIVGTPDEEVLPEPFSVRLDDDGKASVPLAATSALWAWEVSLHGSTGWGPIYVTVGAGDEADWPNLVRVDPATLAPTAEPEAAWWAAWDAMAAGTYLVPDPTNVGLYLAATGSSMTPDPALDGLYTIGAPA